MAVGRLKPGVSLSNATGRDEHDRRAAGKRVPEFDTNSGVNLVPLRNNSSGEIRKPLLIRSACWLRLLIACANVASLLLARGVSRQKEFGLRAASARDEPASSGNCLLRV